MFGLFECSGDDGGRAGRATLPSGDDGGRGDSRDRLLALTYPKPLDLSSERIPFDALTLTL